jgi:hypothetical protein
MRTALMCLVIGRVQNGGANTRIETGEHTGPPAEPAQSGLLPESGLGSLSLARRRRRDASRVRVDPPEAAA